MQAGAMSKDDSKSERNGTRITVTIPPDHYELVCRMAKLKKVSNAWVIRDAVEKYIEADAPLFARKETR
jgi:metal-responsive CopG/Arc/MetJ family transcriptional regulator